MNIVHGDCLEVMRGMADNSVDSIVTDPPYGLSFMGKKWDYDVPGEDIWRECLRVLKPGGHLLAFAGTRTQHRMAVRIEDAGFEIRDMIAWVYGSGFPKSLDVSKAIDKAAGAERMEVIGTRHRNVKPFDDKNGWNPNDTKGDHAYTAPATDAAKQWQGWGTALKPALEPITVARKPLIGTVAENVLAHGTGAINVDGCRVGSEKITTTNGKGFNGFFEGGTNNNGGAVREGRWPANLIHDGSDEVKELFPETKSGSINGTYNNTIMAQSNGDRNGKPIHLEFNGDSGSAARFFYCAKASKRDRDEGCEGIEERKSGMSNGAQKHGDGYDKGQDIGLNRVVARRNHHPTVKPTDLMRYLCRLVTPPGGTVLDPFAGSGSTGKACALEGFRFIGIEREMEYCKIAEARIAAVDVGLFGAAL